MSDVITRLTAALENRYRVDREVGSGGMATVYRAHDLRHERDVAIKVLHPDLAAALGAERFLAEIKTTAKLQHPHILPLLDSGEANGLLYYVMPFVTGESLRSRLDRETQLAVDDAVRIAREVASALDSAHRHGVVHRDIKPENILLHEEQALVADFGIALAVSAAGGPRMTQTGLSLGTPAYMAPEQAMGERVIDGRADIYALGAVLYEMLVGEAPFTGPSVQAIVARVMTEQPRALTAQRRSVPEHVNTAVMRALEKLPADRFHTPGEFSKALITPGEATDRTPAALPVDKGKRGRFPIADVLPWSIAALAVLAAIVFAIRWTVTKTERPTIHLAIDLPPGYEINESTGEVIGISPDGSTVALGAVGDGPARLLLRRLAEGETRVVEGSSGVEGSAEFSPDGRWIAFNADESLFKVPLAGGPAVRLANSLWAHIAWVGNESLVFTRHYNTGLHRVSADGRDSSELTTPDRSKGELGHWWPQVLPGAREILFTAYTTPPDRSRIEVVSLPDGKRRVVLESGYFARYADEHLLFVRGGTVMSVPFDAASARVIGEPAVLPLKIDTNPTNGWAGLAVSGNGTLAYRTKPGTSSELVFVSDDGDEQTAIPGAFDYFDAQFSPDGRKIAVVRDGDVWIYDIARAFFSRITRTEQREGGLTWSPDGKSIYYNRDNPAFDIFRRAVDGSSAEELVIGSSVDKWGTDVSPDGSLLVFNQDDAANDIMALELRTPGAAPRVLIGGEGDQEDARFSPDGKWLVYTSSESGRPESYLVPFPLDRGPARQQVSFDGSGGAVWSPDGKSLFFGWSRRTYRVRVDPVSGVIGRPEPLNRVPAHRGLDMAPDGRFLMAKRSAGQAPRAVKVLVNWTSILSK